ncbi:MAG: hypothetical protein GF409_06245 [Candidatus Omnitrophica bacterium]|nr:hypothetical protein [Candidatus Omnitrophota bacterium]
MEIFLEVFILAVFGSLIGATYYRFCVVMSGGLMNMMSSGKKIQKEGGEPDDQNDWLLTYLVADHRLHYKDIEKYVEESGLEKTGELVNV